mmetsp:Transcript_21623/g.54327  ORF Transcript_21623/g.54327 Transcript_21623/m.54327 type:complete len:83 (-) Transcript_21623:200-448(-)
MVRAGCSAGVLEAVTDGVVGGVERRGMIRPGRRVREEEEGGGEKVEEFSGMGAETSRKGGRWGRGSSNGGFGWMGVLLKGMM